MPFAAKRWVLCVEALCFARHVAALGPLLNPASKTGMHHLMRRDGSGAADAVLDEREVAGALIAAAPTPAIESASPGPSDVAIGETTAEAAAPSPGAETDPSSENAGPAPAATPAASPVTAEDTGDGEDQFDDPILHSRKTTNPNFNPGSGPNIGGPSPAINPSGGGGVSGGSDVYHHAAPSPPPPYAISAGTTGSACISYFEHKADATTLEACAEECYKADGCAKFSTNCPLGCRITNTQVAANPPEPTDGQCGTGNGAGEDQCTVYELEFYTLRDANVKCQNFYKEIASADTVAKCAHECKSHDGCKWFSAGDLASDGTATCTSGCRISTCDENQEANRPCVPAEGKCSADYLGSADAQSCNLYKLGVGTR